MASILKVNTIQDATNSNTAISVDSSGRVTQPVLPCWSIEGIGGTSSNNSILDFANTNNGSSNLSFVQGGVTWSGASDYKITVPVTGVYMVNVGINCRATSSSHATTVRLVKNGTEISSSGAGKEDGESNHFDYLSINFIFSLSANDYLQVKNVGGNDLQFPNDSTTGGYFNGHLLG